MRILNCIVYVSTVILSILYYSSLNVNWERLCEVETCPFCYGTTLCNDFSIGSLALYNYPPFYLLSNLFSVKNVFYGSFHNVSVVFKKLAHTKALTSFNSKMHQDMSRNYTSEIVNSLLNNNNFKVCSSDTAQRLLESFLHMKPQTIASDVFMANLWTIININVEPLILQLLHNHSFPIPKYHGACGRLIVENYTGNGINSYEKANWSVRARMAFELLELAHIFTYAHPTFRFYLTDISPDNIVANEQYKISVIDLENMIVSLKSDEGDLHYSENYEEEFAFNEEEICHSSISDHNFYAVCKILLARDAQWPMMRGGLLHSLPDDFTDKELLFDYIDLCVTAKGNLNRFQLSEMIKDLLKKIIQ